MNGDRDPRYIKTRSNRFLLAFTALTTMVVLSMGCSSKPDNTMYPTITAASPKLIQPSITPKPELSSIKYLTLSNELKEKLGEDGVSEVIEAVSEYRDYYGCKNNLKIDLNTFPTETIRDGDRVTTVVGKTSPGNITLDVDYIFGGKSRKSGLANLRGTVLHEETHACKNEFKISLSSPIILSGSRKIVGFEGFIILINNPDNSTSTIKYIEEGFAEAFAVKVYPWYMAEHLSYGHVGSLSLNIINNLSDAKTVSFLLQKGDFPGLVKLIRGIPNPTARDFELVINWYDEAYNNQEYLKVWEKILKARGKP